MACYTRHLGPLLDEAGLTDDRNTRLLADRIIRGYFHLEGEDCPAVWRTVKTCLANEIERSQLVAALRDMLPTA